MNITPSTIYWITRMDGVNMMLTFVAVALVVASGATFISGIGLATKTRNYSYETEEYVRRVNELGRRILKWLYVLVPAVLATIVLLVLMPTTEEAAAMYVIPAIANNEKVQTVGNRLYDLAVEWMEEFRPAKGEQGGTK